ncbi:MAG: pyruvate formate-lyase [Ruminococcaceae bacterium]|nr:pyruvate formate-lyase [Oscillospiraceae bacterium]
MKPQLKSLYDYYVIDRTHRSLRTPCGIDFSAEFSALGLDPAERMCRRFERVTAMELPRILPDEQIVLTRSVSEIGDIFTEEEWKKIRAEHYVHESGYVSNLSPDYEGMIRDGFDARYGDADAHQRRMMDAIAALCDRYREEAERMGREDVAMVLSRVPRKGARNFREALQFFRILHFSLWLEGDYHNTVGRFDQYIYPYYKKDRDAGVYTKEEAFDLLCDFFLSFNKDSDMYFGQQQGDNGQSMVLGGTDIDGNDCYNELSELCLLASGELKLIDPKINLRVNKNTPLEVYEAGSRLTKAGLGFPQYSNDDVVIEGLEKMGYAREDAVNYVVAACWEFIIPGVGDDIANIGALNLPLAVDKTLRAHGAACADFESFFAEVKKEIRAECDRIGENIHDVYFVPSPFMDLLRKGRKYRNFGVHGCGVASAADALAAIKKHVYDEKTLSVSQLIDAMDHNFENDPVLLHKLRYESPKMGCEGGESAADMSVRVLDAFSEALSGRTNCLGGHWRAGTGTAMFYLWHAAELGATADGRRNGEPFGTNFSPSLFAKTEGPVTVVEHFTAADMEKTLNGGPLTLEFASSMFSEEDSIRKLAMLIKYFISRRGHQLQLNAVNPERMREAQRDPDAYRQLVVRIWGWSAYFVELDKPFQDHVIARQEYSL